MAIKRILTYHIQKDTSVGDYLRSQGYSQHMIQHLKRTENGLMADGRWLYVKDLLHPGDILAVTVAEEESSRKILPVPMDLDIVYEDEDILVLNKPSNMPIHPSLRNYDNTLANGVADYFQKRGTPHVFRCMNRLDRDTTGLTIIAKHLLAASILSQDIVHRKVHRAYLAIVDGILKDSGVVDAPIAREGDSIITRRVDFARGERAVTHYQAIASANGMTLVSLILETGRTHQIRVHMKYLGYPLVGDSLYNPGTSQMDRQALHATRLSFSHPITKEAMEFYAPLPPDMRHLFPAELP